MISSTSASSASWRPFARRFPSIVASRTSASSSAWARGRTHGLVQAEEPADRAVREHVRGGREALGRGGTVAPPRADEHDHHLDLRVLARSRTRRRRRRRWRGASRPRLARRVIERARREQPTNHGASPSTSAARFNAVPFSAGCARLSRSNAKASAARIGPGLPRSSATASTPNVISRCGLVGDLRRELEHARIRREERPRRDQDLSRASRRQTRPSLDRT